MGYPMTYKRFINRNNLSEGGYTDAGKFRITINVDNPNSIGLDEFYRIQFPFLVEELHRFENQMKIILGDLRRLESDTVDESATATIIASRTGIDKDTVAAVLKEFMAW